MPTYKVGQAPWEISNNNPASFKVGEAPWEKDLTNPSLLTTTTNTNGTTIPQEKRYSLITGKEIPSDLAQRQQEQQTNRTVINPKYASGVGEAFSSGVGQIRSAFEQGQTATNPIQAVEAGTNLAAGLVNTAISPVAPLFTPATKVIDYTQNKISDIPEVQEFANSKPGYITERIFNDIANISTIAGAVAPEAVRGMKPISGITKETSVPKPKVADVTPNIPPKVQKLINNRTSELNNISSQYADLRKFDSFQDDGGMATRKRIASTDVLDGAVDENGVIRTKQPGGAVDQYMSQTLDNAENVVRKNLEVSGDKINLDDVRVYLEDAINNSGIEGADLRVALNKVKREISGYKLRADANGDVPLTLLQDAKVGMKANYLTPADIQIYQKAIKRGLKTVIEKNASFNVKAINDVLSPYLRDIEFLEKLDGKRVKGSKLGKYFATLSGNIVGGLLGQAIPLPGASAVTSILGGEVASRIKNSILQNTFRGNGVSPVKNPVLEQAIQTGKYKRLPAPQENSLGNLNQQYNPTPITKSTATINQSKINPTNNTAPINKTSSRIIDKSIPQKKGIIKTLVDKYKKSPLGNQKGAVGYDFSKKTGRFQTNVKASVRDAIPADDIQYLVDNMARLKKGQPLPTKADGVWETYLQKMGIDKTLSPNKQIEAIQKIFDGNADIPKFLLKKTDSKLLQEAKKYKTTINIQDKNDLEYLGRILSEDNIKDIKNGKMVNFRGTPYSDLARVNIISEAPKTIQQQLAGKIKAIKPNQTTFYHGTNSINADNIMKTGFKNGSSLPEDTFRGGGYGKLQDSISFTETPKDASRFSSLSKDGKIIEAKLKDGAKVVKITGIEDAVDLNEYISYLRKQNIDAVYIGGGEKELVVINPKAITPIKSQLTDILNKANKK